MSSWRVSSAQTEVPLINPSFEGNTTEFVKKKQRQFNIEGWTDCGKFPFESPPDVFSRTSNQFDVFHEPFDGETFIGLVTREHETFECVMQELQEPLESGTRYVLSIYASQSKTYASQDQYSRDKLVYKYYTNPVVLHVIGASDTHDDGQLLGASEVINHHEWKEYEFEFTPSHTIHFLRIEVFYPTSIIKPTAGHVLIDNAKLFKYD